MLTKKIIPYLIFATLIAVLSCKKSSDTTFINSFTVKVNGNTWSDGLAYAQIDTNLSGQPVLYVRAIKDTGSEGITLIIDNYPARTGTYAMSSSNNTAEYDETAKNKFHLSSSGSIVLTSVSSSSISGNFNFIADSFTISGGQFNVIIK